MINILSKITLLLVLSFSLVYAHASTPRPQAFNFITSLAPGLDIAPNGDVVYHPQTWNLDTRREGSKLTQIYKSTIDDEEVNLHVQYHRSGLSRNLERISVTAPDREAGDDFALTQIVSNNQVTSTAECTNDRSYGLDNYCRVVNLELCQHIVERESGENLKEKLAGAINKVRQCRDVTSDIFYEVRDYYTSNQDYRNLVHQEIDALEKISGANFRFNDSIPGASEHRAAVNHYERLAEYLDLCDITFGDTLINEIVAVQNENSSSSAAENR